MKCAECNTWHEVDKPCKCKKVVKKEEKKTDGVCIVCEEPAPNGMLCRECYYEMKDIKDSFDKNTNSFDLKDYYFNLRSNIYRMKTFDYVKSNCNKLYAIASFNKELYKDDSLFDRIENDVKEIIATKKPKKEEVVSDAIKTKDSHKEELKRTSDGHYVKSDPEVMVDDILYELRVVHCYEKKVPIDIDEQSIKCDWFIPVLSTRQGIYMEYWGMNTKEYLANKERKRQAYKEHNLPLIEIEKDDYKDKQGLSDRIIGELNKLAKQYFNISEFIKLN